MGRIEEQDISTCTLQELVNGIAEQQEVMLGILELLLGEMKGVDDVVGLAAPGHVGEVRLMLERRLEVGKAVISRLEDLLAAFE